MLIIYDIRCSANLLAGVHGVHAPIIIIQGGRIWGLCASPKLLPDRYMHTFGFGAYHTGVEIAGKEYTFAGGAGIFDMPPKQGACSRSFIHMHVFAAGDDGLTT